MEWVNPRWANRLSGVDNQKVETKSMSGILCAKAPHSIAFLPKPLSKKASPTQAPSAMWVNESNYFLKVQCHNWWIKNLVHKNKWQKPF
jgi:hypothetical protein